MFMQYLSQFINLVKMNSFLIKDFILALHSVDHTEPGQRHSTDWLHLSDPDRAHSNHKSRVRG